MLRKSLSIFLFAAGLALVLTAFSGMSNPQAVQAQSVPQPTPRPSLPPDENTSPGIGSGSGMGHIAGTIIDLTTGAPASGITVMVGEYQLTSDVNGNYDRWLPAGTYTVMLVVTKEQGSAAQSALSVALPEAERVVQHLAFYSPKPAQAAPAAVPAATVVPTAVPVQSKARPAEKVAHPGSQASAPTRLPRTGDDSQNVLLLISVGIALMAGGIFMGTQGSWVKRATPALASRPAQRGSAAVSPVGNQDLLALLLARDLPSIKPDRDEALLKALLERDI